MLKSKFFEVEEEKVIIVGFIDSCSKCRKKKFVIILFYVS